MISPLYIRGEKKFLSPLSFSFSGPSGCGDQNCKARGKSSTLCTPKPSLAKTNCPKSHHAVLLKALFSLLLLVTMAIKAKENGTTIIQMMEANMVPCTPWERERPKGNHWGHWINCLSSSFYKCKSGFSGYHSLQRKPGSGNKHSSLSGFFFFLDFSFTRETGSIAERALALRPKFASYLCNFTCETGLNYLNEPQFWIPKMAHM